MLTAFFKTKIFVKSSEQGFTLIELLVTVVIIGILSAIALPSFLNQSSKAKQSEAKTTLKSITTAQSAYRIESATFAKDLGTLALGLPLETQNYTYEVLADDAKPDVATATATAKDQAIRGYAAGSVRFQDAASNSAIASIICEVKTPGIDKPEVPTLDPGKKTEKLAALCDTSQEQL